MSGFLDLIYRATMGCFCSRETIVIKGISYRVLDHLADGGFSSIDLVEDTRSSRRYALKRIVCHSSEDQVVAQREVEFHRHLAGKPGILECVGSQVVGSADIASNKTSQVLLVLPFFPRGTLHDELVRRASKKSPFSEKQALLLFRQICESVSHMHSSEPNPLAHRDLKPHNVLLEEGEPLRPVLMDLGSMAIARVQVKSHAQAQRLQDEAAERCSITYRAPELFQVNSNCEIDERTDVWSLGCLLYAICFFRSPYDAVYEKGDSVALAVQSGGLKFERTSPYSTDLHNLILWMLTPEMAVRPHLNQIIKRVDDMIGDAAASNVAVKRTTANINGDGLAEEA